MATLLASVTGFGLAAGMGQDKTARIDPVMVSAKQTVFPAESVRVQLAETFSIEQVPDPTVAGFLEYIECILTGGTNCEEHLLDPPEDTTPRLGMAIVRFAKMGADVSAIGYVVLQKQRGSSPDGCMYFETAMCAVSQKNPECILRPFAHRSWVEFQARLIVPLFAKYWMGVPIGCSSAAIPWAPFDQVTCPRLVVQFQAV